MLLYDKVSGRYSFANQFFKVFAKGFFATIGQSERRKGQPVVFELPSLSLDSERVSRMFWNASQEWSGTWTAVESFYLEDDDDDSETLYLPSGQKHRVPRTHPS